MTPERVRELLTEFAAHRRHERRGNRDPGRYAGYHHQEVLSSVAQARVRRWFESVAGT